jgi:pentatricopeptide repeat protein
MDEMDARGIPPNTYTFTAAFMSVDGGKSAMALLNRSHGYKESVEVGVHLYNACIRACSRRGENGKNGWQNALALFRREMPRRGIQPNEQTYACLLHACANAGQHRVAFTILDEMRRNAGNILGVSNDVWGAILRSCATAGDGKMAMGIVKEMLQSRLYPTTTECNSVLAALAREGSKATAMELMEHMQSGTVPSFFGMDLSDTIQVHAPIDLVSVNTVLKAYANSGDYEGATSIFDRLRKGDFVEFSNVTGKSHAIRPDIISYNSLLGVCLCSRDAIAIMHEVR